MSRTIRRKKVQDYRILNNICYLKGHSHYLCNLDCCGGCPYRNNTYTISKYRRDTSEGYGWRISKSKRKEHQKKYKAKEKQQLVYINKDNAYEYKFNMYNKRLY